MTVEKERCRARENMGANELLLIGVGEESVTERDGAAVIREPERIERQGRKPWSSI